jgi:hypothetical protein
MFSFDAGKVVKAIRRFQQLEEILKRAVDNKSGQSNVLSRASAKIIRKAIDDFVNAVSGLNAKTTEMAAKELRELVSAHKLKITPKALAERTSDISITLRRELSQIKTFYVSRTKEPFFEIDITTFGERFKNDFASAIFEVDEAGKCHALGRSTACVFHLMRLMELGIKTIARSLGLPDPVKGSDRNWGQMLGKILDEIKRRNSSKLWKNNDRELFESLYASLDAVRVAWRNTTMHVENKYTDDESEHIFVATHGFMRKLSDRMDENGQPLA